MWMFSPSLKMTPFTSLGLLTRKENLQVWVLSESVGCEAFFRGVDTSTVWRKDAPWPLFAFLPSCLLADRDLCSFSFQVLGLFEMDNADSPEAEQPPSDTMPKPLFMEAKREGDEEESSSLGKDLLNWFGSWDERQWRFLLSWCLCFAPYKFHIAQRRPDWRQIYGICTIWYPPSVCCSPFWFCHLWISYIRCVFLNPCW